MKSVRYRIVTNQESWIVQYKYWWWPFWCDDRQFTGGGGDFININFNETNAKIRLEQLIKQNEISSRKWTVV